MKIRKVLLLLLIFRFVVIFSQESCVNLSINQAKSDDLNIQFTNKCKEKVVLYQYDRVTQTPLNRAYDFDNITLSEKKQYSIQNITIAQSDENPINYQQVKSSFFILNPNESHDFTFPLLIFLKKHKSIDEKNENYYLLSNKHKGKTIQFRLVYDPKIISENLINVENGINLYSHPIQSNMIKVVLQ